MKKIVVIAYYERISQFYKKHIQEIFGALVTVECYYIEDNAEEMDLDADLILVTSDILFEFIQKLNKGNIETIIIDRTFTKAGFNRIRDLKYDGKILFVSTFYELAVESIAQLYELGIRDLKFVPYNPLFQQEESSGIQIAVTAGETGRVPAYIEQIIDIEDRVLDISTIADIGVKLDIPSQRMNNLIESYKNDLIVTNYGFKRMLDEAGDLKKQLNTILSFITDGIIAVDTNGVITEYNEVSERIFGLKNAAVIGMRMEHFFGELRVTDSHNKKEVNAVKLFFGNGKTEEIISNAVVHINNNAMVISKYPLKQDGRLIGVIFVSKKYLEVENEHNHLRAKLIPTGHVAKYTFENVLGVSDKVSKLKVIAEKMAKSDSTILITGESGTGKEVFAQAIHNASARRSKPFLAVNCSALAANLLESELFGYEEGAFTGAKKGGKVGLFELAAGGTIFLDEIGELPYEMQAKLLRVLMEKDIMRVGGISVIHVDARVISATNKDLGALINRGAFREDLYYRLNVLPLSLCPLRERWEDIPLLEERFFYEFGRDKRLSDEVKIILNEYSWPGNIRELRNCMEYMYQMSGEIAGVEDLPEYIYKERCGEKTVASVAEAAAGDGEMEDQILKALLRMNETAGRAGRKSIRAELMLRGFSISEQDVRFILKRLESRGLVRVNRGQKGCEITEKGISGLRSGAERK